MKTCLTCVFDLNSHVQNTYKKNDYIFFEGDEVSQVYLIKDGIIKLEKLQEDGEVQIIDVLKEGDYIALLTILNGINDYKVTAVSLTDSVLTPIPRQLAHDAYLNNLHFKDTCLKCAAHRLGVFQGHTFKSGSIDPNTKILSTLKHLSVKFGEYRNGNTYISLPITKTELANMCGLRRETLSRKLSQLQKDGKIEFNKNSYKLIGM